ncbi:hypothetical protein C1A50_1731 [Paenibacillus polymyxa]|nr:hypothetical protein C1A50_1731 [Paenibacillus polymyxa]
MPKVWLSQTIWNLIISVEIQATIEWFTKKDSPLQGFFLYLDRG